MMDSESDMGRRSRNATEVSWIASTLIIFAPGVKEKPVHEMAANVMHNVAIDREVQLAPIGIYMSVAG